MSIGILVGVLVVAAALAGRDGYFMLALAIFLACLLVVGYRIHRVFQLIN